MHLYSKTLVLFHHVLYINYLGKSSISESLAERRSMVAGILSAGPPKKSGTSKKYKRAETLPIETTEKSEPMVSWPSIPFALSLNGNELTLMNYRAHRS